ncbi:MAG: Potassium efflux system KefA protein [Deltaproteobacteria bacterium]|nr:Potassium efflux system KefA protein [Deltaproteobacteria bacterium]
MGFWATIVSYLWFARTPFLIVAYFVTVALVRRIPKTELERYHMRAAGTLIVGHLVAVAIGAGQAEGGYDDTIAEVSALAFQLLAFLSLGMTVAFRALLPRIGFTLPRIMIDLLTFVGVLVIFIVVGKRAGFSVAGLITTSAVLTAVIGFSLQDTLGNVMGGLSVQLDKSIKVGDWVALGPNLPTGKVTEIRWRYTAIETRNWDTVIVPNGTLVKSQITILGRRTGEPIQTRRTIDFFVDFRTPPTEVITAVEEAIRKDPVAKMAREPAPHVLFLGVRDSYANYVVRYWLTDLATDDPPDSAVRTRVWFALRRAGIPMSIPASTVFLTHETPERESRKAEQELAQRMNALGSVDLFRGLPENLRKDLADQLVYMPFAAGEAVTREGDRDDGLYMLVKGEAVVRIGAGDDAREVASLIPGQFFGEMSLMTGEARTASVVAMTDVVCYRVDKPAFQHILRETPSIADQIADVLVTRRTALSAVRDERDDLKRNRTETAKQDLLGRIRGFFGINDAH